MNTRANEQSLLPPSTRWLRWMLLVVAAMWFGAVCGVVFQFVAETLLSGLIDSRYLPTRGLVMAMRYVLQGDWLALQWMASWGWIGATLGAVTGVLTLVRPKNWMHAAGSSLLIHAFAVASVSTVSWSLLASKDTSSELGELEMKAYALVAIFTCSGTLCGLVVHHFCRLLRSLK